MKHLQQISLVDYHTFGVKQTAEELFLASEVRELPEIAEYLSERPIWLGAGANTLFVEPIQRPLLKFIAQTVQISEDSDYFYCRVDAGKCWPSLVQELVSKGIGGLENLALIPGTVGAAPVQNIGAYGVEFDSVCDYVEIFDWASGKVTRLAPKDCKFGYRDSIFKRDCARNWLVVAVGFKLAKAWQPKVGYHGLSERLNGSELSPLHVMNAVVSVRQSKLPDPSVIGNGGSFFKNPEVESKLAASLKAQYPDMPQFNVGNKVKIPAGWMIDRLGWKGKSVGGAAVHENQALVLVNRNEASPENIVELASRIKADVQEGFGVTLTPEVRFIGSGGEVTLEQAYEKSTL